MLSVIGTPKEITNILILGPVKQEDVDALREEIDNSYIVKEEIFFAVGKKDLEKWSEICCPKSVSQIQANMRKIYGV
jgi:hypothetical protein